MARIHTLHRDQRVSACHFLLAGFLLLSAQLLQLWGVEVVAVGGRTGTVQEDGQFHIYGVPTGMETRLGPVIISRTFIPYEGFFAGEGSGKETDTFIVQPSNVVGTPPWRVLRPPTVSLAFSAVPASLVYGTNADLIVTATDSAGATQVVSQVAAFISGNVRCAEFIGAGRLAPKIVADPSPLVITAIWHGSVVIARLTILPPIDSDVDHDGIPNRWELLYGLDPGDPLDAERDPDLDGLTNLQEYQRGTNPLDPDTDHDGLRDDTDPDPLVPEREVPVVAFLEPVSGATVPPGQAVRVRVQAVDNAVVRQLTLLQGQTVLASVSGPLIDTMVTTPAGGTLELTAVAFDQVRNRGTASLSVQVQEQPQTVTIRGRVVDGQNAGVAGANVHLLGTASLAVGPDGRFELVLPQATVPSTLNLAAQSITISQIMGGFISVPNPGGALFDVGNITLSPRGFDSNLGTAGVIPLENAGSVSLPFAFPFYGGSYSQASVSGHGLISFGADVKTAFAYDQPFGTPVSTLQAIFTQGPPRLAPLWSYGNVSGNFYRVDYGNLSVSSLADRNSGFYTNTTADTAVLTWFNARHGLDRSAELDSFQSRLRNDGAIANAYTLPIAGSGTYLTRSVVGISPGGSAPFSAVDLAAAGPAVLAATNAGGKVYPSVIPGFDLGNHGVAFAPQGGGGYAITGSTFPTYGHTLLAGRLVEQGVPAAGIAVRLATGEATVTDQRGYYALFVDRRPLYVASDATGAKDGSSWVDAFSNLQSAIDAAYEGDEIWVKEGIYRPSSDEYGSGTGRSLTFHSTYPNSLGWTPKRVAIYGGFAGTEVVREQRNVAAHRTIISGDIGAQGSIGDNCFIAIHLAGPNSVLDGVTVTGANGSFGAWVSGSIRGCTVVDNSATGICSEDGEVVSCVIARNTSAGDGAGIRCQGSLVRVENCLIYGNISSRSGGALSSTATAVHVIGNTIVANRSQTLAAVVASGGAPGQATVLNSIITGNLGVTSQISSQFSATYSSIAGLASGVGNVVGDPLFIDPAQPAGPDGIFGTNDDGLRLQATSPCLDSGSAIGIVTAYDVLHADRFAGPGPDMGAYEAGALAVAESIVIPAALDRSRVVAMTLTGGAIGQRRINNVGLFVGLFNQLGTIEMSPQAPQGQARRERVRTPEGRVQSDRAVPLPNRLMTTAVHP